MEERSLTTTPTTSGKALDIVLSREVQSVQAAMVIAQRCPRDTNRSLSRIIDDCKRRGLAERAVYSYPRGGQTVSGPSIRLAETIAKAWGNLDYGIIELDNKAGLGALAGESTLMAYCWDLETNVRSQKIFTVRHKRDTKGGGKNLTEERDIYEIGANMGARRLRACILSIIPTDIVDSALEQCDKTMEGGQGPLIDRIRAMAQAFGEFSVTIEMIETRLGHKLDVTTESELVNLRKIYTSLKDNFADRADYFEINPGIRKPADGEKAAAGGAGVEVKSIKNFAPQTAEEAKNRKPGESSPEPRESAPQQNASEPAKAPQVNRGEIAKQIGAMAKRAGYDQEKLALKIQELTGHDYKQCTNEELQQILEILTIEAEKKEATNG